jgi:hypothetical protein
VSSLVHKMPEPVLLVLALAGRNRAVPLAPPSGGEGLSVVTMQSQCKMLGLLLHDLFIKWCAVGVSTDSVCSHYLERYMALFLQPVSIGF